MRKILSILLLVLYCSEIFGQSVETNIKTALNNINQGYIQYGVTELQSAAKVNSVIAQYYLAVCYEHGISLEKNQKEAFLHYRKAAERGLADAMYHIADFYKDGIVVEKNEARYDEWMKRYLNKGGKLVLPDLIVIYNEGLKHPENYALNPNSDINNDVGNAVASNNVAAINNITIVQQITSSTAEEKKSSETSNVPKEAKSDVDCNIPETTKIAEKTFALIIANEEYQDVASVPNAINDGTIFAEYCRKTLGLPETNIHLVKNATLNNIKRELNIFRQIMNTYKNEAKLIVYYAGHGIPDETTKSAYILPIDGYGSDISTCFSLGDMYNTLGEYPASQVIVILDACFSGTQRGENMLYSARGVALKAKKGIPTGNVVVLSAAQGDETAYPYSEQKHGLFTYYLLKKLKETKGECSLGELSQYVTSEVSKKSIIVNRKPQTPTVSAPSNFNWINLTLK